MLSYWWATWLCRFLPRNLMPFHKGCGCVQTNLNMRINRHVTIQHNNVIQTFDGIDCLGTWNNKLLTCWQFNESRGYGNCRPWPGYHRRQSENTDNVYDIAQAEVRIKLYEFIKFLRCRCDGGQIESRPKIKMFSLCKYLFLVSNLKWILSNFFNHAQ
jgi:hypothetical protein